MSAIEKNTFKILQRAAKCFGWAHHVTHRQDESDHCTFWFHLMDDDDCIVGFDWHRENPNIVKTVAGSLPTSTQINLTYITTFKQLSNYFRESRKLISGS